MGIFVHDEFDDEECLAFFRRSRVGRIGLSLRAMPVVLPAPYFIDQLGFVVGVSSEEVAEAMADSIIALQADGWAEDSDRRWTTLAVGPAERIHLDDEIVSPGSALGWNPLDEPYLFRLRPHILSGRWL